MKAETDLLKVVLALQMGFVTKEQVKDVAPRRSQDMDLSDLLIRKGYLKHDSRMAVEAFIKAREGDFLETPQQMLASLQIDEEIFQILMGLPLEPRIQETLLEWRGARPPELAPTVKDFDDNDKTQGDSTPSPGEAGLRKSLGEKYEFKEELGRGGLGKVVEAVDKDFGREVAVKMMLPGQSTEAVERFLFEGRAAGKLSHPNIVPVHEIGVLKQDQGEAPYFTMTKIVGRDLREILQAWEKGDEDTRKKFNRPRLLRVFQEVCNAIAYAHDHGVIHRDLKPANVMVGEYGEVFVVDWGLAKVLGPKEEKVGAITRALEGKPGDTPQLTIDGQVMGTPAYMPPEQAKGRIAEIDERSDIYSLGAILYEILTFHPPFSGETAHKVISRVLTEDVTPPSLRISQITKQAVSSGNALSVDAIPSELDDIVLRALSKDKSKRYSTAGALADDIQHYLEGEKERERNHQMAMSKVAESRSLVKTMGKLREELRLAEKESEEAQREMKPYWPIDQKEGYWAAQDRVEALRREIVETFTKAGNTLHEALGFERMNPEARSAMADLYWNQYLREEEGGDAEAMIHYEGLVRQYNDGQYSARLKGDGTLSISTQYFPCTCLSEGRKVAPNEMDILGYHPFSGRALDGRKGSEGLVDLEPAKSIQLKTHGVDCKLEPLNGANVWLFRYKERKRILLPVFPDGVDFERARRDVVSNAVLNRCFDENSPYRPDEGLRLGKTPITDINIPMGSYLLIIAREGFHPVRCPILIGRQENEKIEVTLYRDGEIPKGFVPVPSGKFICQGDRKNPYSGPREIVEIVDAFISGFPVTCREYLIFLNDSGEHVLEDCWKRAPRKYDQSGFYWPRDHDGKYVIPTQEWLSESQKELRVKAERLPQCPVDWNEDWPVFGISWEDAKAYSAWYAKKHGVLISLPFDDLWEKAARGTDGRFYPWGNHMDATFCNCSRSHEGKSRPCPVHSFSVDESPYGIRGLGGNAQDICLNDAGSHYPGWRRFRGGAWDGAGPRLSPANRTAGSAAHIYSIAGFRLACYPRSTIPEMD
ncbi:MAG: protein kinase domain-containing protein [Planctomycetota bacterium]|jgi:serine/threonine protein kinase/formylglycine-generating enzyme required for sulfatase activity